MKSAQDLLKYVPCAVGRHFERRIAEEDRVGVRIHSTLGEVQGVGFGPAVKAEVFSNKRGMRAWIYPNPNRYRQRQHDKVHQGQGQSHDDKEKHLLSAHDDIQPSRSTFKAELAGERNFPKNGTET